jgi:transcriptional regulator with XRE-family HTH domain
MGVKTSHRRRRESLGPASSQIGPRLRELREQKGLFQRDIEERTGLLTCYISRVENGYKLPSLGTLERFALALNVPLYRLFYGDEGPPPTTSLSSGISPENLLQTEGEGLPYTHFLQRLARLWTRMGHFERQLLLEAAMRMAARPPGAAEKSTH